MQTTRTEREKRVKGEKGGETKGGWDAWK